jgi:putative ABC transport system permease protein
VLPASVGEQIQRIPGVASASPVLLMLAAIRKGDLSSTVFLTGFDVQSGVGGPPHLLDGRSVKNDDEIVLDVAYARRMGFTLGDVVRIQDDTLRIVGVSTGTNAFVIQYAFVTLSRARQVLGVPTIVTCFLLTTTGSAEKSEVADLIREALPMTSVYDHATFVDHNTREMQAGFLPFIYTIAAIGVVVLTVIVSLLLTITVLEQRYDFAILKALGAPAGFLPRLLVEQGLMITMAGFVLAMGAFFPMVKLVEHITPEIATQTSGSQVALIGLAVAILSLVSSLISLQRLRRIYPLEAFA